MMARYQLVAQHILTCGKKEKFIRGENISLNERRKRPNNGREEKSLKDAGQFLVVKKFYKIKPFSCVAFLCIALLVYCCVNFPHIIKQSNKTQMDAT